MSKTCSSTSTGYGGQQIQTQVDCGHLSHTGLALPLWIGIALALIVLGLLARYLARSRKNLTSS